jgi:hypothetical protein
LILHGPQREGKRMVVVGTAILAKVS